MNVFNRILSIVEGKSVNYSSGGKYTAKVYQNKDGTHVAKFFSDGNHMVNADYQHKDRAEVDEFAREEMEYRRKQEAKLTERILEPQGHKESPDKIADDSEEGRGKVKKMMGNRTPLEIITKILAGK